MKSLSIVISVVLFVLFVFLFWLLNIAFSYSRAAWDECLSLRESEANAGYFSPRRQTNMNKLRLSCRKKGQFETLKGFGGLKINIQA